ncbi:SOS response-associated peptidase [Aureimonas flava]|uniref:Abasic site processing protein n=1 Tax=Aureimonas flava TaxID=2320271 RepID=A0A3A1WMN5_9HYPH|nr:SOS response-associated peptidase [Aureimonas flava]
MCGRFALTATPEAVAAAFDLDTLDPFPPRYNVAPTQPVLHVALFPRRGALRREARLAQWGLIPGWAKDPAHLPLLFNARAETAAERQSFRGAMRHRRCLVPATGFYEWRRAGGGAPEPFWVRPADGAVAGFAGLHETFLASDGSEIDTVTILTAAAGPRLSAIHARAPVVVAPADVERWLDVDGQSPAGIADLLHAGLADAWEAVPVSGRVNAVANMGPEVQERVSEGAAPNADAQLSLFRDPPDGRTP